MIICEKCGAQLNGFEKFCPKCGNIVVTKANIELKDMEDSDNTLLRVLDDENLKHKSGEAIKTKNKAISVKSYLVFLIPAILVCLIFFIATYKKVNKIGNNFSNYANGAGAAKQGDWIYYSYNGGIYRVRTKGGEPEKFVEGNYYWNLSIIGDYIYCNDESGTINRINMKDKSITNLLDMSEIQSDSHDYENWVVNIEAVTNKDIYFLTYTSNNGAGLYRTGLDGSNTKKIAEGYYDVIYVDKEYIYCINYPLDFIDENNQIQFKIIRLKKDGSDKKILYEDYTSHTVRAWIDDNRLYFVMDDKLYQFNYNTKEKTVILDSVSRYSVAVQDGWIYYVEDYNLYKRWVGSDKTIKISEEPVSDSGFYIFENHILYKNTINEFVIIKTNGKEKAIIKSSEY